MRDLEKEKKKKKKKTQRDLKRDQTRTTSWKETKAMERLRKDRCC